MKIQINITKEVLNKSAMCMSEAHHNCAIAVAIRDLFPTFKVFNTFIENPNGAFVCYLPEDASDFIRAFDDCSPSQRLMLPELSFEIDVPQKYIDKIGIDEAHRILSTSKTMKLSCVNM